MNMFDLLLILTAWIVGAGSPGPATLAISGVAMEYGRRSGLTIAAGIVFGSACWGVAAAFGVSKLMVANVWLFEMVRYFGAAYLMYLAIKSLRSAARPAAIKTGSVSGRNLFIKGALLHITNPKAILGWGSVYAIALPAEANQAQVWELFSILITASMAVFLGYGLLFSLGPVSRFYRSMKRWFELAFGILFGAASLRLFSSRIEV